LAEGQVTRSKTLSQLLLLCSQLLNLSLLTGVQTRAVYLPRYSCKMAVGKVSCC